METSKYFPSTIFIFLRKERQCIWIIRNTQ